LNNRSSSSESSAQKRESFRIQLGFSNAPILEFPESIVGEQSLFAVIDLSEGGLSFDSTVKVASLETGATVADCYLEFNAIDRVRLGVTIRHIQEETLAEGNSVWHYGCSVDGLSAEDERLVRRTIQAQERRQAQSRSRFV